MRLQPTDVGPLLIGAIVVAVASISGAQQASPPDQRIAGCLQRAPSGFENAGRFVLMNASNSPLGGAASSDSTPPTAPPRSGEPIERRPGQSDARQETGGVSYLLQGGSNLESLVGQRVEVQGVMGPEVHVAPRRPTMAQPWRTVQVKHVRAIAPSCSPAT